VKELCEPGALSAIEPFLCDLRGDSGGIFAGVSNISVPETGKNGPKEKGDSRE